MFTVERSQASAAAISARSALSQLRAVTKFDQRAGEFCRPAPAGSRPAVRGSRAVAPGSRRCGRSARRCGRARSAPAGRPDCRAGQGRPRPSRPRRLPRKPASAAARRRATAHWISDVPVATMSTRSASISSGECSRIGSATEAWSVASARTIAGGASVVWAKTFAIASRTSGDGSSSSISSAPSVAAKSSEDISEKSQARARARVASARSPAGAVRTQPRKCRTIIGIPHYATCDGIGPRRQLELTLADDA